MKRFVTPVAEHTTLLAEVGMQPAPGVTAAPLSETAIPPPPIETVTLFASPDAAAKFKVAPDTATVAALAVAAVQALASAVTHASRITRCVDMAGLIPTS